MEVGEQALYLAQLKGLKKKDALIKLNYWFEKFEIKGWWKKKVDELSKGMQQKVQFIVTILHEPTLLILDEPFSGFDPINSALIKNEIIELKKKGATIILSTHNMNSVEELCDNIALIHKSKKILDGAVKEIRKAHKTNLYELEYQGNFIAFANALGTTFELVAHHEEEGHGKASVKIINSTTPNQLLQAVLPHVEIHSFKEIMPSMNDVFVYQCSNNSII